MKEFSEVKRWAWNAASWVNGYRISSEERQKRIDAVNLYVDRLRVYITTP